MKQFLIFLLCMQIHHGYYYGPEVDWWAIGVVMYEMMVGRWPFVNLDEVCSKYVQYPSYQSWNAVSILEGVSIIFQFYFNFAQVVVVGFM
jgi:serine/threonine protein kinase